MSNACIFVFTHVCVQSHEYTQIECMHRSRYGAQVLDQVADEKSLIIAVGYMLRSSPAVVAAKQLMKEVGCLHVSKSLSAL